jgi:hypothetical protein
MAVLTIIYRVLLPFVAIGLAIVVTVIFGFSVHHFDKLNVKTIASTSYAGLVMFLVACLLVVCITVYCSIVFDKVHRVFLMVVALTYCLALGGLTLFLFHATDTMLEYVQALWDDDRESLTAELEQAFECQGFDFDAIEVNSTASCATVIRQWVDARTRELGKVVGICWCILVALTLPVCVLSCRKDESDYGNVGDEMSLGKVGGMDTAADVPDL